MAGQIIKKETKIIINPKTIITKKQNKIEIINTYLNNKAYNSLE